MKHKKITRTVRKYYPKTKRLIKSGYVKTKRLIGKGLIAYKKSYDSGYLRSAREANPDLITGGVLGYRRTQPTYSSPRRIKPKQKIIYKTITRKKKKKGKKVMVKYVYVKQKHHKKIKRRRSGRSYGSQDYFFGGLPRTVADIGY